MNIAFKGWVCSRAEFCSSVSSWAMRAALSATSVCEGRTRKGGGQLCSPRRCGLQSQLPSSPPRPWTRSQANFTALWFFKVLEQNDLLCRESAVWSRLPKTSISQPRRSEVRVRGDRLSPFLPPSSGPLPLPLLLPTPPGALPSLRLPGSLPCQVPTFSASEVSPWGALCRAPGLMAAVRHSWMTTHPQPSVLCSAASVPHSLFVLGWPQPLG